MNEPAVTVVIVTYESEDTIDAPLEAGKAAHDAGVARYVVVDNDSADATVQRVRERHPWVTLIENGENVGFGRGCNVGIAHAETPYVLFLNPDATMAVDQIRKLADFMDQHPDAALAAPSVSRGPGEYEYAGSLPTPWRVLKLAAGFDGFPGRVALEAGMQPFQTDWISGAVFIGRTDRLREVDGFDPRFFLYFDETDLCRRLLDRGYEIWAVGETVAEHAGAQSAQHVSDDLVADCLPEHYFVSRFYYLVKHHGWVSALMAEAGELVLLASRDAARRVIRGASRGGFSRRLRAPIFRFPRPTEPAAD